MRKYFLQSQFLLCFQKLNDFSKTKKGKFKYININYPPKQFEDLQFHKKLKLKNIELNLKNFSDL